MQSVVQSTEEFYIKSLLSTKFIIVEKHKTQFTATKYIKRILKTLCDAGIQLTLRLLKIRKD